ncbi:putative sporulation protein YtxC [Paenibacillus sacheonensis]|uniref:Sporulation protein n=1 Tax=Paenibacillus sacheonensis TaxID=742054 RepID=A0A7X5BYI4_9BACL|nr:putative sporulation protein YtxC [Paenibacillus sacheonensis]MBM7565331.1 putative sporulation protein YtxC [Paenibacillus sacheonensis]NBC69737.1 sporulation protein [Paenibacillus sacheonensis]
MELFTVSLHSASHEAIDRLHRYLSEAIVDVHSAADTNSAAAFLRPDYAGMTILCQADLPKFQLAQDGPPIYRQAAAACARYILGELEPMLLKAIIRKQFHYEDAAEIEALSTYCHNILYGTGISAQQEEDNAVEMRHSDMERRLGKVADELEQFLSGNTRLHLDGFVSFRLAAYWQELKDVVAYAVDEYVMDKQYQEFISLLKYFVRMQEVKLPIVHVLHVGGSEFVLYDQQFQLLDTVPADRIVAEMLESEMNMEDMIVSTLITVSPQQIVIHTRQPELPVMRTLETIFEQRVRLCCTCGQCSLHFEESDAALAEPAAETRIRNVIP